MKEGTDLLINSLTEERIVKEIVRILKIDAAEGLELLKKYNLADLLMVREIKKYLNGEDDD